MKALDPFQMHIVLISEKNKSSDSSEDQQANKQQKSSYKQYVDMCTQRLTILHKDKLGQR